MFKTLTYLALAVTQFNIGHSLTVPVKRIQGGKAVTRSGKILEKHF